MAGASAVFRGSIVSYASDVKFDLLGVPDGPVVSADAAAAMAVGARRVLGADVGLALTGVAGPTEQDGQPVGTLFVGLAIGHGEFATVGLVVGGIIVGKTCRSRRSSETPRSADRPRGRIPDRHL